MDRNLHGNVKFVFDSTYNVADHKELILKNGKLIESFYLKFNKNGFIIEEGKSGEWDWSNYVSYSKFNESAMKIEEIVTGFNKKGKVNMQLNNYYENGKLHESNSRHPLDSQGSTDRKSMFKYNDAGNLLEALNYSYDGTLNHKTVYKYNNKNLLIEESEYENKASSLSEKHTYEYDTKGNKILSQLYDYGRFVSIKNDLGNDTIVTQYNSSGRLIFYYSYKYDEFKNLIEYISYSPDGSLVRIEKRTYDKLGNMTESRINDYLGDTKLYIQKFSYEYDSHHNWIKQKEFNDEKPIKITVRKITYFN